MAGHRKLRRNMATTVNRCAENYVNLDEKTALNIIVYGDAVPQVKIGRTALFEY
jgi:hypothetical protein